MIQMPEETITAPNGEKLRKIASVKTTENADNKVKSIYTDSTTIEVIISDSRLISSGSQFGHVAIIIDDTVYGRAPNGWDTDSKSNYLVRQQVKMNRDSVGFVLRISSSEKSKLLSLIKSRMSAKTPYDLGSDSCSSNAAELLGGIGIQAHDPRWSALITPTDMAVALSRSKRLSTKITYPKSK